MSFRVSIAPAAFIEVEAIFDFIRADSPLEAGRWLDGLLSAVDALGTFPRRCRRVPEAAKRHREIRQLLYGSHRVIFRIVDREVRILHVRHTARRPRM